DIRARDLSALKLKLEGLEEPEGGARAKSWQGSPTAQNQSRQCDESTPGRHSFRELARRREDERARDPCENPGRDQSEEANLEWLNSHQPRLVGIVSDREQAQSAPSV